MIAIIIAAVALASAGVTLIIAALLFEEDTADEMMP